MIEHTLTTVRLERPSDQRHRLVEWNLRCCRSVQTIGVTSKCRWGTSLIRERGSQMSYARRSISRLDSSKHDAQTQGHRFAKEIQVPDSGCPQLIRLRSPITVSSVQS